MSKTTKILICSLIIIAVFAFANEVCAETLNFTLKMSSATSGYRFSEGVFYFDVDGDDKTKRLSGWNSSSTKEFSISIDNTKMNPENIKLVDFPNGSGTFAILDQNYDTASKTLNVRVSRNVYIKLKHLVPGINFNNLAFFSDSDLNGLTLGLYGDNGKLVKQSQSAGDYGQAFYAVEPGIYTIKIDSASKEITEKYDLSRTFKLEVKSDGKTTIDGNGPLGFQSQSNNYLDGVKMPFQIWLSSLPTIVKEVKNSADAGEFAKAVNAKAGDEVEFKIKRTIKADHNYKLSYSPVVFESKVEITFYDEIPKGLEYIDGTLKIMENGAEATDFTGNYDANTHRIVVKDKTKTNEIELPYDFQHPDKAITIPVDRTIEIIFKCKVLDGFGEELINNAIGNGKESLAKVIIRKKPSPTPLPKNNIPETGDASNIKLYAILAILGLGAALTMLIKRNSRI